MCDMLQTIISDVLNWPNNKKYAERGMEMVDINRYFDIKNQIGKTRMQRFIECFSVDSILSAPIKVEIALTNACNQMSSHCSNSVRVKQYSNYYFDKNWIEQVVDCNPFLCILTGGEPIIHPDFIDIVRRLKEKGIILSILSNGTQIDKRLIKRLKESGMSKYDCIQISLDAASEEHYMKRRGTADFYRVLDNIELLVKSDISVDVHYVPTAETINAVADIYKIANQRGATSFSTASLAPIGNASDIGTVPTCNLIEHEIELIEMSQEMETKYLGSLLSENCSYMHMIKDLKKDYKMEPKPKDYYECSAGSKSVYVDEKGDVYICVYASVFPFRPLGNIADSSLTDIWRSTRDDYTRGKFNIEHTICGSCEYWGICTGGCLGVSSIHAGAVQIGHDTRCNKIKEDQYGKEKSKN